MSRKKIVSLFLAVVFTLMIPMTAFATPGFNRTVFDNAQDISQSYDDMTGQWSYATESLLGEAGTIDLDEPEESVVVYGTAGISYKYDLYNIVIKYYARNWAFIDTVCVKIGNKRYNFTDYSNYQKVFSDATIRETMILTLTSDMVPFMEDLIQHRDEEIKIRLYGEKKDVDFVMSKQMKDSLINLYDLYVAGGGTRAENLNPLSEVESMKITITKLY